MLVVESRALEFAEVILASWLIEEQKLQMRYYRKREPSPEFTEEQLQLARSAPVAPAAVFS